MEGQTFRTIDDSNKVVKDSWSKDIAEIRSLLHEFVENLASCEPTPVEFQRFCGKDLELWISQAERYFEFHGTSKNNKLLRASLYLDGEVFEWFRRLFQNKQLSDWEHFIAKVRIHFGKQHLESPEGHVATIREYSTNSEAQVFDKMSYGYCGSKGFATERSAVKVVSKAIVYDLKDAKSEKVQVFDGSSHRKGNTLQSHSETLQTGVPTEVQINQIGISTNSIPMTSLVGLTGYNLNVTKSLKPKNKEEKDARDNATPVSEISLLRDKTGYQIYFTNQRSIMSSAIGRFTGIELPFASATQNLLGHHYDSNLHLCDWLNTGQEHIFTGFLLFVSRETQRVHGGLEAFADGNFKQLRFRVITHSNNVCVKLGIMPQLIQSREKHKIFAMLTYLILHTHDQHIGESPRFYGVVYYFDYMDGNYRPQLVTGALIGRKETITTFLDLVLEGLPYGSQPMTLIISSTGISFHAPTYDVFENAKKHKRTVCALFVHMSEYFLVWGGNEKSVVRCWLSQKSVTLHPAFDPGGVHHEIKISLFHDSEYYNHAQLQFEGRYHAYQSFPSGYLAEDLASIWHCDKLLIVPSNDRSRTYDSVASLSRSKLLSARVVVIVETTEDAWLKSAYLYLKKRMYATMFAWNLLRVATMLDILSLGPWTCSLDFLKD